MTITAAAVPVVERMSHEEMKRIQAYKVPEFRPPYPSGINVHAEKTSAEGFVWMEQHSLDEQYKSGKEREIFINYDVPDLAMRVYVDSGEKECSWCCKYFVWFFVLDDHLDKKTFSSTENWVTLLLELNMIILWSFPDVPQLRKNFVELLDECDVGGRDAALEYVDAKLAMARLHPGTVYDTSSPEIVPLCKAFRELWAELAETMPADFMFRFGETMQVYILRNFDEIRLRQDKSLPSIDKYIALRRVSVGAIPCLALVDYMDNVSIPNEVFYSTDMQDMIVPLTDYIWLHNDLWSFKKEILAGDKINLVYILSQERSCSYEEAGTIVYQMLLDKLVEIDKASEHLQKATLPEYKHAVSKYIKTVKYWVSGTFDWHDRSPRYNIKSLQTN